MKKVIILLLVLLAACQPSTVVVSKDTAEPVNEIRVSGSSEFDVSPDLAEIRVRVETQGPDAQEAQRQNSDLSNSVFDALLKAGVRRQDIETYNYNIHRVQEWNPDKRRTEDKGFRVSNSFKVTTRQLGKVGGLLDAAVQAGANNVEGISFMLSDDRKGEARTEALKLAAKNAQEKARALADGLNVPLGRLVSVSESTFGVQPVPYARAETMEARMDGAPTPVEPQGVRVSAQVQVSYAIGGLV